MACPRCSRWTYVCRKRCWKPDVARRNRARVSESPLSPSSHYALDSFFGMAGKQLRNGNFINEAVMECQIHQLNFCPCWDFALLVGPGTSSEATSEHSKKPSTHSVERETQLPEANPQCLINMGSVLMNLSGDAEAWCTLLPRCLRLNQKFSFAFLHAAHCSFSLGDPTRGLRYATAARRYGSPQRTTLGEKVNSQTDQGVNTSRR